MPAITRTVALVGRPNVGKSRLFNRLAGKRVSIVHDQPGVTRDVIAEQLPADKGGYLLMDTGGIGLASDASNAGIVKATEEQVDFAIAAAGLVVFVTDAHAGCMSGDERIANHLRTARKPTILVANKADDARRGGDAEAEFSGMGFGEIVPVSAEHGHGINELHARIMQILGPPPQQEKSESGIERIKFALIGRPNVGKSSLGNALLKDKRLIVSEVPGTTRDAISIDFDFASPGGEKWSFTLQDTAGLRPRTSVKTPVEFFSQNRSREAIAASDVVFLVLDALEGVTKQDKVLAGEVIKQGRGLAIVVNKWDLARKRFQKEPLEGYANIGEFQKSFIRAIEREMFFLPKSPIIFTSATEGTAVTDILHASHTMVATMCKPLPTGALNRLLRGFIEASPPKIAGARRFKCYYAVQVARQPFVVRMYCNSAEKLDDSYARHLAAGVQTAFKLNGCPMRFDLVGKPPREVGTKFKTAYSSSRSGKYSKHGPQKFIRGENSRLPRIAEG